MVSCVFHPQTKLQPEGEKRAMPTSSTHAAGTTAVFLLLMIKGMVASDPYASAVSIPSCEFFVAANGSDTHGDGSIGSPFATPQRAVAAVGVLVARQACRAPLITLRSGRFELEAPLQVSGSALNDLQLRTHAADLAQGLPAAELSGGRRLPPHPADADGVWRADLKALGVRPSDAAERIFTLFVDGSRRQRVRSALLRWNHSISGKDPCRSCDINRFGFVFGPDTFGSWDLSPTSTAAWLLVSFHQWATGVHTVRQIFPHNRTLFVNEPVFVKYAGDHHSLLLLLLLVFSVPFLVPVSVPFPVPVSVPFHAPITAPFLALFPCFRVNSFCCSRVRSFVVRVSVPFVVPVSVPLSF
jgi:hypothetical protein